MGGSLLQVKNRGYFFDHTSKDLTDYTSRRRSLYLPVVRNNVYDVFQLLDFPDPAVPSGDRTHDHRRPAGPADAQQRPGDAVGGRPRRASCSAEAGTDDERLARMYAIAYGRAGIGSEDRGQHGVSRRGRALARAPPRPMPTQRRRQAWSVLCQTILAANEFIYVQ